MSEVVGCVKNIINDLIPSLVMITSVKIFSSSVKCVTRRFLSISSQRGGTTVVASCAFGEILRMKKIDLPRLDLSVRHRETMADRALSSGEWFRALIVSGVPSAYRARYARGSDELVPTSDRENREKRAISSLFSGEFPPGRVFASRRCRRDESATRWTLACLHIYYYY